MRKIGVEKISCGTVVSVFGNTYKKCDEQFVLSNGQKTINLSVDDATEWGWRNFSEKIIEAIFNFSANKENVEYLKIKSGEIYIKSNNVNKYIDFDA